MLEIIPVFWQQFKDNKRRVLVLYRGGVSSSVCCEQNETQLEPAAPQKETRVCIFILYTGEKYIYIYIKETKISDKTPKGSRLMAPIEYTYFSSFYTNKWINLNFMGVLPLIIIRNSPKKSFTYKSS